MLEEKGLQNTLGTFITFSRITSVGCLLCFYVEFLFFTRCFSFFSGVWILLYCCCLLLLFTVFFCVVCLLVCVFLGCYCLCFSLFCRSFFSSFSLFCFSCILNRFDIFCCLPLISVIFCCLSVFCFSLCTFCLFCCSFFDNSVLHVLFSFIVLHLCCCLCVHFIVSCYLLFDCCFLLFLGFPLVVELFVLREVVRPPPALRIMEVLAWSSAPAFFDKKGVKLGKQFCLNKCAILGQKICKFGTLPVCFVQKYYYLFLPKIVATLAANFCHKAWPSFI